MASPFVRRFMGRLDGAASIREDAHDPMYDPAMDEAQHARLNIEAAKHPVERMYPEQCLAFRQFQEHMYVVFLERNLKYGPHNIRATGQVGIATRKWDKMARYMETIGFNIQTGEYTGPKQEDYSDETFEDTLTDQANYSAIAWVHKIGKWGL